MEPQQLRHGAFRVALEGSAQIVDEGNAVLVDEDRHFPVEGAFVTGLCAAEQGRADLGGENDARRLRPPARARRPRPGRSEEDAVVGVEAVEGDRTTGEVLAQGQLRLRLRHLEETRISRGSHRLGSKNHSTIR